MRTSPKPEGTDQKWTGERSRAFEQECCVCGGASWLKLRRSDLAFVTITSTTLSHLFLVLVAEGGPAGVGRASAEATSASHGSRSGMCSRTRRLIVVVLVVVLPKVLGTTANKCFRIRRLLTADSVSSAMCPYCYRHQV